MKNILLLTVVIFSICSCSKTQPITGSIYQKILPGSELLNLSKIKSINLEYTKIRGHMKHELKKMIVDDNEYFKLSIDFVVSGKSAPDTIYCNSKDFSFSHRTFYNAWGKYTGNLKFSNKVLTGTLIPKGIDSQLKEEIIYNKEFEHPVFEPAALNYILGALPLKVGFTASLPMLDLDFGSRIIWANIEVQSKETIKVNGKKHETWKIVSNGSRNKIFWI